MQIRTGAVNRCNKPPWHLSKKCGSVATISVSVSTVGPTVYSYVIFIIQIFLKSKSKRNDFKNSWNLKSFVLKGWILVIHPASCTTNTGVYLLSRYVLDSNQCIVNEENSPPLYIKCIKKHAHIIRNIPCLCPIPNSQICAFHYWFFELLNKLH